MPRRGLTRRMVIASGLLTVVLVAGFVAVFLAIDNLDESTQSRRHIREELVAANALELLVIDLETGIRGFVITREAQFLEPWTKARAALPSQVRELEQMVAADPIQRASVGRIAANVDSYIRDYGLPLVGSVRRNEASANTVAVTAEGRRRIDAVRAEFGRFLATAQTTLAARERSADRAERLAVAGAGVGAAGSLLLVGLFIAYLSRVFVRPVRRAALMADTLAGGDLSARMPENGIGEIGTLERSFNLMANALEQDRDEVARLAAEQAALRRVATLVARAAPPDQLFATVTREVGQLLDADRAYMGRYGPDETVTYAGGWARSDQFPLPFPGTLMLGGRNVGTIVAETSRPARIDGWEQSSDDVGEAINPSGGIRSAVGTPIVVDGRLWGVMVVHSMGEPLPQDTEARLADFTDLVATAIANAESRAHLAASRARIVTTADETRRRIERDLHDGAQQRLVSLTLELRTAQAAMPPHLGKLEAALSRVAEGMTGVLDDLREIAQGIHPGVLAEGGLVPALRTLARRSPIPVELDVPAHERLSDRIEIAVYYVVSETLTNAAKHAQASLVHVDVAIDDRSIRISVRDDGVGGADSVKGSGLVGLKDRAESLGGTIAIASPPGVGTRVDVELPLDG